MDDGLTAEEERREEEQSHFKVFTTNGVGKAIDSAHLGLWDYNAAEDELVWNRHMFELFDAPVPGDFSSTCVDITANVTAREREMENKLLQSKLEEECRHKEVMHRLIRTICHEIRNPLQGMLSNGQSMQSRLAEAICNKDGVLGKEDCSLFRTRIDEMLECSMHQLSVINDLLDFETVHRSREPPTLGRVDMRTVVASVICMFKAAAHNKSLELRERFDDNVGDVLCHEQSIKRVLMNLVGNAIKFTEEGSVCVDVDHDGKHLIMAVKDTGSSVPEHLRAKLFYEFGITQTNAEYLSGTGLGLNICKNLVDALDGTISFEDNVPKGAMFTVRLPAPILSRRPVSEGVASSPWVGAGAFGDANDVFAMLKCQHCLMAEDNRINQKVLTRMLTGMFEKLTIVDNGQLALEELERACNNYHYVVLDVHMPVMGGVEAAKIIRERMPEVPIVFLTGEIASSLSSLVGDMMPVKILLKPCTKNDLLQTLISLRKWQAGQC